MRIREGKRAGAVACRVWTGRVGQTVRVNGEDVDVGQVAAGRRSRNVAAQIKSGKTALLDDCFKCVQ